MSGEPAKPDNLQLWNDLGKTNPAETKQFRRSGGFSGTAIKPMWVWQRLTDRFGPMGTGWGCAKPEFQVLPGAGTEVLVYCTVAGWYTHLDGKAEVFGVGGDKVIATYSKGPASDDEAFKKAYTDALMNAFKFIGVGADVHMGRFDDTKYVQDLEREFNPPPEPEQPKRQPLTGKHKTRAKLREVAGEIATKLQEAADGGDESFVNKVLNDYSEDLSQIRQEGNPEWWSNPDWGLDVRIKEAFEKVKANAE